jgi:hypothetical protein
MTFSYYGHIENIEFFALAKGLSVKNSPTFNKAFLASIFDVLPNI